MKLLLALTLFSSVACIKIPGDPGPKDTIISAPVNASSLQGAVKGKAFVFGTGLANSQGARTAITLSTSNSGLKLECDTNGSMIDNYPSQAASSTPDDSVLIFISAAKTGSYSEGGVEPNSAEIHFDSFTSGTGGSGISTTATSGMVAISSVANGLITGTVNAADTGSNSTISGSFSVRLCVPH